MFDLRNYQGNMVEDIYRAWNGGARNVLSALATGGGKTVIFSFILNAFNRPSVAIAHRQELVAQISLSMASFGLHHRIIAPSPVANYISRLHIEELGRCYVDPNASSAVAGVLTLASWAKRGFLKHWLPQVGLWVQDEAHHVLQGNTWGKAVELFPNAIGLGVTATPCRADGKGLGAHADGYFHELIEGPSMGELIKQGYLCDYINPATGKPSIYLPASDYSTEGMDVTASGDWSTKKLRARVKSSHVVGDIVEHYKRLAMGKLGITFVESIDTASEVAARFNANGVPAAVISSQTKDVERRALQKRFVQRDLWQLVNVDLFGEGTDVPALEVISMGRPTESVALYRQQFGRVLRIMEGKTHATIIDHVGNITRHGLPDKPMKWTLDRVDKATRRERDPDEIPLVRCDNPECAAPYEAIYSACPYCGHRPTVASRSGPEFVAGDLCELTPEALLELNGRVLAAQKSPQAIYHGLLQGAGYPAAVRAAKNQAAKISELGSLKNSISWWAGAHREKGRPDSEIYRRFFFRYGTDIMTAQALGKKEALALNQKLLTDLQKGVA